MVITALFSACAPRVHLIRWKPAEVAMPNVSRVAVSHIDGNDGDPLGGLLSEGLVESNRFEVLDRTALDKIFAEQGLSADAAAQEGGAQLGKVLPASALITGRAHATYHEHVSSYQRTCERVEGSGEYARVVKYPCTEFTREGKLTYNANLRVLDTTTTRILVTRAFEKGRQARTSATDGEPRAIDRDGMITACRDATAAEFLHMVAPYKVQEVVELVEDGDLPELGTGNEYAKRGEWAKSLEFYGRAVARIDLDPKASPKTKGRAHYALGLALAFNGDYKSGIAQIEKAFVAFEGLEDPDSCGSDLDNIREVLAQRLNGTRQRGRRPKLDGQPRGLEGLWRRSCRRCWMMIGGDFYLLFSDNCLAHIHDLLQ